MNRIIESIIHKAVNESKGFEFLIYANCWIQLHYLLSYLEFFEYETN